MTCFLFIACGAAGLVWAGLTLAVWRVLGMFPWVAPNPEAWGEGDAGKSAEPVLSVVVPARNEGKTLAEGLESILAQRDVGLEVIVVNDHSTDSTGEIADRFARDDGRLRVLHSPPLPAGWLGKTNAMHRAASTARGRFILFTDADIVHAQGSFATALGEMERRRLDLLSLLPFSEWVTLWENAIVPGFFLGAIMLLSSRVSDPDSREGAAAGAFILVRTETYRALGGHGALRAEVLDDVQIARHFKRAGRRAALLAGPELVRCRMYRSGGEAFWGFSKNILDAAAGRPWWLTALIWPLYAALITTGAASVFAGMATGNARLAAAGGALHLFQYATLFLVRRFARFDPLRVFFFPVAAISSGACLMRAFYFRAVRGSVVWRGREVRVGRTRPRQP